MSLLRIKPVSSRSKIDTLREFGHRVFIEVGEKNEPINYFVEFRGEIPSTAPVVQKRRRPAVGGNVALMWSDKEIGFRSGSMLRSIADLAKDYAAIPTRRQDLVDVLTEKHNFKETQASNAISQLTVLGYLVVPG